MGTYAPSAPGYAVGFRVRRRSTHWIGPRPGCEPGRQSARQSGGPPSAPKRPSHEPSVFIWYVVPGPSLGAQVELKKMREPSGHHVGEPPLGSVENCSSNG